MTETADGAAMTDEEWQRLDPRMLLVHPVKELVRFLPVLFGVAVAGGFGEGPWALIGVGVPILLGVVRYLTTTYRVTDDRVELRHGLLHRHTLSTHIDRVRTVDITASPVHRVLGLATVVVGTGSTASDDNRIKLDGLRRADAAALRTRLFDGSPATTPATTSTTAPVASEQTDHATPATPAAPASGPLVAARFSTRWIWYAPFTGSVLAAGAALLAGGSQILRSVNLSVDDSELSLVTPVVIVVLVLAAPLVLLALFMLGYLLINGDFRLTRQGEAWHIGRGLLTHRETGIDVDRVAGVVIGEAGALRLARGRYLLAIVTGLRRNQQSSSVFVPPAPRGTVLSAARTVLGSPVPVEGALHHHGPSATTRRYSRALLGVLPVACAVAIAIVFGAPAWIAVLVLLAAAVAVGLAADRARSLGHAHLAGHVVLRSGSLQRRRSILEDRHVIGWNQRATWFQRRVGLVSVAATTAGGSGRIEVYDVPVGAAIELARAATPDLLEEFLAP